MIRITLTLRRLQPPELFSFRRRWAMTPSKFVKEIWPRAVAPQSPHTRRASRTVHETDFKTSFPWAFGLPRELTKPKPGTLKALPRVATDRRLQTRFSKKSFSLNHFASSCMSECRFASEPLTPGGGNENPVAVVVQGAQNRRALLTKNPEPERRQVNATMTSKPPWSREYVTSSAR